MTTIPSKDKATILAGFPPPVTPMTGQPTLREIIRVLLHITACAQSLFTDISPLNYLFLALNEPQYARVTQELYPEVPADPGEILRYQEDHDANERSHVRDTFNRDKTWYTNCLEMDKALTERFMSLLEATIRATYETSVMLTQPNATFITVIRWFVDNYAHSNELHW